MSADSALKKRIFFVPNDAPDKFTEIKKPGDATRFHVGEVNALRAKWNCACHAELAMVEQHKIDASSKTARRYWRSIRVADHEPDCDWRKISDDAKSASHFDSTGFKDQVRDGYAVVLSMLPEKNVQGADYRYAWLHGNNIPQRVLDAKEQLGKFNGRYTRVGVKEFGDIPKTLEQIVDLVGHLDHVYLEYRGGMRPIKRIFQDPGKMPRRFYQEAVEAAEGLVARQRQADHKEKLNFTEVAMFPELGTVQPSNEQMKDIRHGEKNGQMIRLAKPALRGRGHYVGGDDSRLPGQVNYTHDVIFSDAQQREQAVAGLKASEPLWALFIPRVQDKSWYAGVGRRNFNAHFVVGPEMMQIGALPSRVLGALQTPYRDFIRNPQYAGQESLPLAPSAPAA